MIKLHGLDISGNTYKAKLLMSFLNINFTFSELDISKQQHKSDDYLKLNPRGEFPVLEDDSLVIWDSQAILVYLANKYGGTPDDNHWYPGNAAQLAHITQWLTVANDDIFNSLGKARSVIKFSHEGELEILHAKGKAILHWIDQHLSHQLWLATDHLSIADIACYPYIALCEEGKLSLNGYPAIHRWLKRIQETEGYISMPGIFLIDLQ